jgi:hypothetical protein
MVTFFDAVLLIGRLLGLPVGVLVMMVLEALERKALGLLCKASRMEER